MKEFFLILLSCSILSCCIAQDSTSSSLSIKSVDSIMRVVINNKKLITYRNTDSICSKFCFVDKKSKELFAAEIINHYYRRRKEKFTDYYRFIYYFYKEELIKLYVIECTSRKNCKKGIFYFSNGRVIHKEGLLTDDSYLKKPLEFSQNFKSFVKVKVMEAKSE